MEYRSMANRYIISQTRRVGTTHYMNYTSILNVRSSAHTYAIDIASNYSVHPDATIGSYINVADNLSTLINKRRLRDAWMDRTKWAEH